MSSPNYSKPARWASVLAAAALLAGCGSGSSSMKAAAPASSTSAAPSTPKFQGAPLTRMRAPAFTLRDQNGKRISLAGERGSYVVVAFLYTHCKDVCPLIANELNTALRELRTASHPIKVLAVSVDPRGDTPAAVRSFVKRHHLISRFHYLIGSRAQLEHVWAAYNVAAYPKGSVLVAHTASELLIDPQGIERVAYPNNVAASQVVHDVRLLERS
jgi:protein SCO1